jgi:uncharacterized repeat protein (TIGR01451 family)
MAVTVAVGSFLLAGSEPLEAADPGTSDVYVVLSGYGEVTVSRPGVPDYLCNLDQYQQDQCLIPSVPDDTKLTLEAVATPTPTSKESRFLGWSRPECDTGSKCEVTTAAETADEEWIAAQFSPLTLIVDVLGEGTLTASGPTTGTVTRDCNNEECFIDEFAAGERVTVTGESNEGAAEWGFGCDPYEANPPPCILTMSGVENWVTVGFGQSPNPSPPFNFGVNLRVDRDGDGQGSVTGSGHDADSNRDDWSIDCGSDCDEEDVQYQTRVRLTARATPGTDSEFDRWTGPPCLSQEVCTFTVGKYPKVRAIFKKTERTPPRQPPDVELTKVADRSTASVGDTIVFRIEVRIKNSGGAANKVVVSDTLPATVELVSARANRGQGCTGSQTITCDLDFLSGTLVGTVEAVVRVRAAGEIVNRASASVQPSDPNPSNNTATARVIVEQPPDEGEESGSQKGVTRTGTARADILRGTPYADVLTGLGGNDRLFGLGGPDRLVGGRGADMLNGGAGPDVLDAGRGNDLIRARDRSRDTVRCGPGRDRVIADRSDLILPGCERVARRS